MGENRRVPPSRHPPETGERPAETGLAAPSPVPEGAPPASAAAAGEAASGPERAAAPGAGLPRRVRGVNGARPPARVERLVLPESLAERLHAAVAASRARDEDEDPAGLSGPSAPDKENERPALSLFGSGPPAGNGGAPPDRPVPPFTLRSVAEQAGAADAITQPIPVISDRGVAAQPSAAPAAGSADQQAAAPGMAAGREVSAAQVHTSDPEAGASQAPQEAGPGSAAKPRAAARPPAPEPGPGSRAARPAVPGTIPGAKDRKRRSHRVYRMAGLVVVLALAVAAGSFAAFHHRGPAGPERLISSANLPPGIRNGAGTWVASQIATGDTVACDPVMCRVLQTDGMASARLRVLWPGSHDLSGCAVIVATPVLQAELGARLASVDAPAVIARFGAGDRQIDVRAVAPQGGPGTGLAWPAT